MLLLELVEGLVDDCTRVKAPGACAQQIFVVAVIFDLVVYNVKEDSNDASHLLNVFEQSFLLLSLILDISVGLHGLRELTRVAKLLNHSIAEVIVHVRLEFLISLFELVLLDEHPIEIYPELSQFFKICLFLLYLVGQDPDIFDAAVNRVDIHPVISSICLGHF